MSHGVTHSSFSKGYSQRQLPLAQDRYSSKKTKMVAGSLVSWQRSFSVSSESIQHGLSVAVKNKDGLAISDQGDLDGFG